jgi:hypothetical protein
MIHEFRCENAGKHMATKRAQALKGGVLGSMLDAFQTKPNAADMAFQRLQSVTHESFRLGS